MTIQMDERYWDAAASDYDGEIHDSIRCDRNGVVTRCLDEHADASATCFDFGCGVGKYLPALARRFAVVHALDLSQKLLDQACEQCASLTNIHYHKQDLSQLRLSRLSPKPAERPCFATCMNVLIMTDRSLCFAILRNIHRTLADAGRLALLVPSLESALYANQRLLEWNQRLGVEHDEAVREGIDTRGKAGAQLLQGSVMIDGVPTKHYLREQAALMLHEAGFELLRCEKVEYDWTTEFVSPPRWMREPYPWDWLFVAEKA